MDKMREPDLEQLYGPMVSLETLAGFFRTRLRALQAALRREQVTVYEFGDERVVALRDVEARFGLGHLIVSDEETAHERAKWRATHREDGSVKPPDEYLAELRAKTPELLALIQTARRQEVDKGDLVEA
jgi:hypothetical protein